MLNLTLCVSACVHESAALCLKRNIIAGFMEYVGATELMRYRHGHCEIEKQTS